MITKRTNTSVVLAASILAHALSTPAPASTNSNLQDRSTARQRAREIHAERERKKAENKEFLERFQSLSPEERVSIWKQANDEKYSHSIAFRISDEIQELLAIEGTDTVPQLAAIVRDPHDRYFYRFWAMGILADMDRYVPERDLPKGVAATLVVRELDLRGAIDLFAQVTGRRIGAEGRETLQWAAAQTDDKWLQFFARDELGLVKQELPPLPIDEQVRRWRDSAVRARGKEGQPEKVVQNTLGRLLVERAPESLPAIINLLYNDNERYIRSLVVGLVAQTDAYRFRLRKSELGRSAIEAVHKAVLEGKVRLECPKCSSPAATWAELSGQFHDDDFALNPGTLSAHYAQMLHLLYGENTIRVVQVGTEIKQEWAIPEFTAFITFLTDKDPFFPSWEYTYFGPSNSEAFHPRFADKMARIEDAWKQYKAGGMASSVEAPRTGSFDF